jgi:hypothetical protein
VRGVIVAAGLAATCALPAVAAGTVAPHVSQQAVRSWQVLAPGWSKSDKEAGRVDDVLRVGHRLYVAGNFTVMANHAGRAVTRWRLAAVRPRSGVLTPFAPRIDGRVYALAATRRLLIAGGAFSSVNGRPRRNLAAFSLRTGRLSRRLSNLGVRGTVTALAATRSAVYVGGMFSSVGGRPRGDLAKLVVRRGRVRLARRWAPRANGGVRDIVVAARRVIAGGTFTAVNGRSQQHIAALSPRHGRLQTWADHPPYDILDLAVDRRAVYAAEAGPGGTALKFRTRNGRQRWYYKTDGNVQAVTVVRGFPVFGMHGDYVAPRRNRSMREHGTSHRIQRHKIFMLSYRGTLQRWNPGLTSTAGVLGVWALAAGGGNVYVGGDFTAVHGVVQQRLAILPHR